MTTKFTLPDKSVTDVPTCLRTLIWLEKLFIAAYLAAAQGFAILDHSVLAQTALLIASVEAEHRVGAQFFAVEAQVITGLPNDVDFLKGAGASEKDVTTLRNKSVAMEVYIAIVTSAYKDLAWQTLQTARSFRTRNTTRTSRMKQPVQTVWIVATSSAAWPGLARGCYGP